MLLGLANALLRLVHERGANAAASEECSLTRVGIPNAAVSAFVSPRMAARQLAGATMTISPVQPEFGAEEPPKPVPRAYTKRISDETEADRCTATSNTWIPLRGFEKNATNDLYRSPPFLIADTLSIDRMHRHGV
jgi:hypothetical protein